MAIVHAVGSASGHSITDCHFLGHRWDPDGGIEEGRRESGIYRKEGKQTQGVLGRQGGYEDLYRLDSGRVYVVTSGGELLTSDTPRRGGGAWVSQRLPRVNRVWGLHDNLVFAWNSIRKEVHVFDGSTWSRVPTGFMVTAIHGVAADLIYACGWGGSIMRWRGHAFHPATVAPKRPFFSIFIVNEDEMYATLNKQSIWEGSVSGWSERTSPRSDWDLLSIAKWNDRLWLGDQVRGLCVLDDKGELQTIKPNLSADRIEARSKLLVSSCVAVAGSDDGTKFKRISDKLIEKAMGTRRPLWEK